MSIEVNSLGLRKIPMDTPEGWHVHQNANWDILASIPRLGGLAIRARDLDPATLLPTSRYYDVAAGLIVYSGELLAVADEPDRLAPASSSVVVWCDAYGTVAHGAAFPTDRPTIPLGRVTCDAAKITAIEDYRGGLRTIGGPLTVHRVAVDEDYLQMPGANYIRADATDGAIVVTLGDADNYKNQLIYIRKADGSANPVHVDSVQLIGGVIRLTLTATGTVILTSTGTTWEVVAP